MSNVPSQIRHKIGARLVIAAARPIEAIDPATGDVTPVSDAQTQGYVPSAKLRSRSADGPVLGTFSLTWSTPALWILSLDTAELSPGVCVVDLRVDLPSTGGPVFSETHVVRLEAPVTR